MLKNQVSLDENTLICPCCGGNNLHQETVELFWSKDNNDLTYQYAKSSFDNTYVDPAYRPSRNNPSSRRQGMLIHFECEGCDSYPELAIFQHKGSTYIKWFAKRVLINELN